MHVTPEQMQTINKVVNSLAHQFRFGYFDIDDIKQQGRLFALEALPRYDKSRPLENFLYTHIKNRFINFKRDKLVRPEPPCVKCKFHTEDLDEYDKKAFCSEKCKKRWRAWILRNSSKYNLMQPLDISYIRDENEDNMRTDCDIVDKALFKELLNTIDKYLSVELRADYLRMRDGVNISRQRKEKVRKAVLEIIQEYTGCSKEED